MPSQYPRLVELFCSSNWAITAEAIEGIVAALYGLRDDVRFEAFHGVPAIERVELLSDLGEPVFDTRYSRKLKKLGSISITGPIVPRADSLTDLSGLTSIDRLTSEFRAMERDTSIDQILLVIDSPGGAITGIADFAELVNKSDKPVAAHIYGLGASAAYWIAAAADRVTASPSAVVGSIGTVMSVSVKKSDNRIDITNSRSPKKRIDPATAEGRAETVRLLDELADTFIGSVARYRNVTIDTVIEKYGEGGVMGAVSAHSVGMIDSITTLQDAVQKFTTHKLDSLQTMQDNTQRHDAFEINQEINRMSTLLELMASDRGICAEVEAIKQAAREEFRAADRAAVKGRVEGALPYLRSASYPDGIKDLAAKVVVGDASLDALLAAVAAYDAVMAAQASRVVAAESAALPKVAAISNQVAELSTDGVLRTSADIDAEIIALRGGRE